MLQGFAFGMVFVAVNTVAFLTLPDNLRTYGASFQTLIRNVASSFGISVVIAQLTDGARRSRAELGDFVNPFNDALKMPDVANIINMATDSGRALIDQMLNMQALIIAYANDFRMLTFFALLALPVAFVIGPTKATFIERTKAPPPAGRQRAAKSSNGRRADEPRRLQPSSRAMSPEHVTGDPADVGGYLRRSVHASAAHSQPAAFSERRTMRRSEIRRVASASTTSCPATRSPTRIVASAPDASSSAA